MIYLFELQSKPDRATNLSVSFNMRSALVYFKSPRAEGRYFSNVPTILIFNLFTLLLGVKKFLASYLLAHIFHFNSGNLRVAGTLHPDRFDLIVCTTIIDDCR